MFSNLALCVCKLVDYCCHHARSVVVLSLLATVGLGVYVGLNIKINTDIDQLLSDQLGWRQREAEMGQAFPHKKNRLVIVIDGNTPDAAEMAALRLSEKMKERSDIFQNVTRPDSIPFFRKNGLLFLPSAEVSDMADMMIKAQPLLGTLAADPSLRGLFGVFPLVLEGLERGDVAYDKLDMPFSKLSDALEKVIEGSNEPFPWRGLMATGAPKLRDVRKFIITQPVLDYTNLMPGSKARTAVRDLAQELSLTQDQGVHVRMTGSVALNDDEFASVADGTTVAGIVSVTSVIFLLVLALRSFRIIIPILITLSVGLVATTAFATLAIGSLNLISVAFAVMFVGIAVDFGIQFGIRYRDSHFKEADKLKAMHITAQEIASPLMLAAATTTIGFLAFVPTEYRGVAELGWIASAGMVVAFFLNLSLLPALIALFKPPAEAETMGYAWAAPLDRFLVKYRFGILISVFLITLSAGGIALNLRFDFDPLNLKDPQSESLSTLFDMMKDPDATPYTVEILEPNLDAAKELASKLDALPEVDHTITLASFIPKDQEPKRAVLEDANFLLAPTLNPATTAPQPSAEHILASLAQAAEKLGTLGADKASAHKLAATLQKIAEKKDAALLNRLHDVLISGITAQMELIREILSTEGIALETMTDDLRKDWITPDGRAKIEVYPKGNPRDHVVLAAFTKAVRHVAPHATGSAISIQESGRTISSAFAQAGVMGIFAVALLSWFFLRRMSDVIRLMIPLFVAGILTLATMVMIHLPLNFANIIALPLLLSLGVSYSIYFVMAWRNGVSNHLQTGVARAVLFSAATTLVAFGSLAISAHVGTSGMGKLLTIALLYSLICTFFVLPPLLGPAGSRKTCEEGDSGQANSL